MCCNQQFDNQQIHHLTTLCTACVVNNPRIRSEIRIPIWKCWKYGPHVHKRSVYYVLPFYRTFVRVQGFKYKEMAKAIREADGKALLFKYFRTQGLGKDLVAPFKCATVTADVDVSKLVEDHPWLGREVHLRGCFCYDCYIQRGGSPRFWHYIIKQ